MDETELIETKQAIEELAQSIEGGLEATMYAQRHWHIAEHLNGYTIQPQEVQEPEELPPLEDEEES